MTLDELIAKFRVDSDDVAEPYLASNANITDWLNEAQEEAAIRARLLHDFSTLAVCSIAVTAGLSGYALHSAVLDITRAAFIPAGSTTEYVLTLTDRDELDRMDAAWRTRSDTPRHLIQTDTTVQLGCLPRENGVLAIECHRLPLIPLVTTTLTGVPEIGRVHHRHLIQWVLHRHYSRPDAEVFNPTKAATALAEFTRVFGLRPDADYRRSSQSNRPAHNVAVW